MLLYILALTVLANAQSPCGTPVIAVASPKIPTILSEWTIPGQNLNLTCAYASMPNDELAMVMLGIICGATNVGPYVTFPATPFIDYVTTPTMVTCPWQYSYFKIAAYNHYSAPVSIAIAATAIINGREGVVANHKAIGNSNVATAVNPAICSTNPYNITIGGGVSKMIMYWTSPGQTFSGTCFGLYTTTASDLEVAYACSPSSAFSKDVVPLYPLPQWVPSMSLSLLCPNLGYFGIIVRNKASVPVQMSFMGSGTVYAESGESTEVRAS